MNEKIFVFISSLVGGGAERVAVSIANSLENSTVVTCSDYPAKYNCHRKRISLTSYSPQIFVRLLKVPVVLLRYFILLKKEAPIVSLSFLEYDNLYNILSSPLTKTETIISVHYQPSSSNSTILNKFIYFISRIKKIRVIAVSNGVRDELIRLHGLSESQISVIYNPMDISTIQELAKEEELDSRVNTTVPLIITVGRLNAVKGQWHLIRAFAELRKKQECQLLICGEGPEKEYLSGLIRNLDIEDDVVFLGWQENPYKYMKRSTVFVQSSLSEALPNVLVESMACGCPVVAAGCSGGIEEILGSDSKCGFIVGKMSGVRYSAKDVLDKGELDMYSAMLRVIGNIPLYEDMSEACKERAKMFDLDIGVQKYVELIEDVYDSR